MRARPCSTYPISAVAGCQCGSRMPWSVTRSENIAMFSRIGQNCLRARRADPAGEDSGAICASTANLCGFTRRASSLTVAGVILRPIPVSSGERLSAENALAGRP